MRALILLVLGFLLNHDAKGTRVNLCCLLLMVFPCGTLGWGCYCSIASTRYAKWFVWVFGDVCVMLYVLARKDYCLMSFECRSNALGKLLFVSKRTFQYAYHVTTCPALKMVVVVYGFFCGFNRDDGRCVRTSLR